MFPSSVLILYPNVPGIIDGTLIASTSNPAIFCLLPLVISFLFQSDVPSLKNMSSESNVSFDP